MTEKQPKPNLTQSLAGLVHDVFKAAGLAINQTNQERIEIVAPRFADAIKREARDAALTLAKRLQAATIEGFENFGKSIDRIDNDVVFLRNEVKELKDEIKRLTKKSNKDSDNPSPYDAGVKRL